MSRSVSRAWAVVALAFYAVHGSYHLVTGHPANLLWACHLATLLVALGYAIPSATLNAIGFLWLVIGNVMWMIALVGGEPLVPTSLLTHVGGFVLSAYAVKFLGFPNGVWWKTTLAFLILQQGTRWLTPPTENVNLAFAVWTGWEKLFPSYVWYCVMLNATGACSFWVIERFARSRDHSVSRSIAP